MSIKNEIRVERFTVYRFQLNLEPLKIDYSLLTQNLEPVILSNSYLAPYMLIV